jgi:polynucleotide 5'-hydroxyl-kinase GRC3/NOL9
VSLATFEQVFAAALQVASGAVMFLGATDTGKTTLAHSVYRSLQEHGQKPAYLDCDVGQSTVGPPATIGLRYRDEAGQERRYLFFVGSNSPRGHLLPMVVGTAALATVARRHGCSAILVDTTGFVDPRQGGVTLKLWKAELLRPSAIVALEREGELQPILRALRGNEKWHVLQLPALAEARRRERAERVAHRALLWRAYFQAAQRVIIGCDRVGLWQPELLQPGRLVGLDGQTGLCIALGIVDKCDGSQLHVFSPLPDSARVSRIRPGSLILDPRTGQETPAPPR